MSDPFVGQIALFGFPFAPQGWAFCDGKMMALFQNIALFQVIGNNYGGNGQTTFALPNLQGRAAIGAGQGTGLSTYEPGESGGDAAVTLQTAAMPRHAHGFSASSDAASATSPQDNLLARALRPSAPHADAEAAPAAELAAPGPVSVEADFYSTNPRNASTALAASSIAAAGQNRPHNNMQPSLALNFCIALRGTVPARP